MYAGSVLRRWRFLPALASTTLLLAACAGSGSKPQADAPAATDQATVAVSSSGAAPPMMQQIAPGPFTLKEAYLARREATSKLVGLTFVQNPIGAPWLYVGDAATDDIVIFDAPTGRFLSRFGKRGSGVGEFSGITGLDAIEATLFVAEAGNRRVQVFYLPENKPMASFGDGDLESPQGVFVRSLGLGRYQAYVIDAVAGQLVVKVFQVSSAAAPSLPTADRPYSYDTKQSPLSKELLATIPLDVPVGTGVAIEFDDAAKRALVAYGQQMLTLDFDGHAKGAAQPLPGVVGAASGVGLFACPNDESKGYWIVGDRSSEQQDFRVYDRVTLAPLTSYRGERIRNSSAMVFTMESIAFFNFGATFAIHEQTAVGSLGWEQLARQTGLRRICL